MLTPSPNRTKARNPYSVKIGYVPLLDAAPLLIASELGYFQKHSISVTLRREPGWASVRDKLSFGELDCAHAPIGLSIALNLGSGCLPTKMIAPLMVSIHGNAITLNSSIPSHIVKEENGLKSFFTDHSDTDRKPTFAAVHPWSSHAVMIHSWLARHGLFPGKDVEIIYLPPPVMVRNLKAGTLDGFCVGEPWNSQAIIEGTGWVTARSSTMANGEFEKALIMSEDFASRQPEVSIRLIAALREACEFCSQPQNIQKIIDILAQKEHLDCSKKVLENALGNAFHTGVKTVDSSATSPFISSVSSRPHAACANWLVTGLRIVGTLKEKQRIDVAHIFSNHLYDASTTFLEEKQLADIL